MNCHSWGGDMDYFVHSSLSKGTCRSRSGIDIFTVDLGKYVVHFILFNEDCFRDITLLFGMDVLYTLPVQVDYLHHWYYTELY